MKKLAIAGLAGALALGAVATAQARVTRIVIDEVLPFVEPTGGPAQKITYEQVAGRAFGELDPKLPGNAIIQDIELGRDADGKARYVATFLLIKPKDMRQASGMMWHDVPNRGGAFPMAAQERAFGDVMLASAWQGDNAGRTAVRPTASVAGLHWLQLPVARGANGDPRRSLDERYGSHAGYVEAVRKAAAKATAAGFLLPVDADGLIRATEASKVLR